VCQSFALDARRDEQDRDGCRAHDLVGHTPQEQSTQGRPGVRRHGNRIGAVPARRAGAGSCDVFLEPSVGAELHPGWQSPGEHPAWHTRLQAARATRVGFGSVDAQDDELAAGSPASVLAKESARSLERVPSRGTMILLNLALISATVRSGC
jgi:hypothetical protein